MNYYLDTEFHEFKKKPLTGKAVDTIELISIGVVDENGREYYAVCNEFDLKAAWNKWQSRTGQGDRNNIEPREYWLRENVLRPVFKELLEKERAYIYKASQRGVYFSSEVKDKFTYRRFKKLLSKYGKSREVIAKEVLYFSSNGYFDKTGFDLATAKGYKLYDDFKPEFYAYFADYDWVVFCWLFGRMIDLPKGFPMYCKDLKQLLDEKTDNIFIDNGRSENLIQGRLEWIETLPHYPKQTNEHNALADAKWNKKLHEFIKTI